MKQFKRFNTAQENNVARAQTVLQQVDPNAIQEGDRIEAHFPCGCIERGVAVLEEKVPYHCWYRNKRRMMLCADGEGSGHVITGLAGFPDGTRFFKLSNKAWREGRESVHETCCICIPGGNV